MISTRERRIEIGTLQPNSDLVHDVSLPLSLDTVNYPQMGLDSIKAWYLFLSIIRQARPEEYEARACCYTFPALEFAKMMNMKQPRGARVSRAFIPLSDIPIQIVDGDGLDIEKQKFIRTHLITRIEYDGRRKQKPISLWIEPIINDLIFHSKENIDFDFQDIARLNSAASIHVFTILWRLHLKHIHTISLQEFKEKLGVSNRYKTFRNFARTYIKPVEQDIRTNTSYKNFRFIYSWESATGKKIKVTTLNFEFDEPKQMREKIDVTDQLSDKLSKDFLEKAAAFTSTTQELLVALCNEGYAVNTYMNLILKVISTCSEAAFRQCALQIMMDATSNKETLKYKYGKILTKELKALLRKGANKKEIINDTIHHQSFEDQQKWIKSYYDRAKKEARKMTVDQKQELLEQFEEKIKEYMKDPSKFNRQDILTLKPDLRRSTYRAFVNFLSDQYRTGILPIQPSLF